LWRGRCLGRGRWLEERSDCGGTRDDPCVRAVLFYIVDIQIFVEVLLEKMFYLPPSAIVKN
jgi:hypothetical protein